MSTAGGHGAFEAWLIEPYERFGSVRRGAWRGMLAMTVFGLVWGALCPLLAGVMTRMSVREIVLVTLVNELAICGTVGLTWWLVLAKDVGRVEAWIAAGHPTVDAPGLVRLAKTAPGRWATWAIGIYSVLGVPTWMAGFVWSVEPLRLAIALIVAGGLTATLVVWPVVYFIAELSLRPVFATIAAHAPAADLRGGRSHSLRTRALLPVPLVTLSTGVFVGGLMGRFDDHATKLYAALGISMLYTLMFTALLRYLVISAALRPVDDLTDGVTQVASGDLTHRVPITSTDEFAGLARALNEMTERLAAHDADIRASRARIVTAADESRRRVERDLHDGAQQYLVLLELKLGLARRFVATEPEKAAAMLDEAREDLGHALAELRDLAHGLYPAVLESDGLAGALKVAADRSTLPAIVETDGVERLAPEVEAAVYFCCLEAMQNAAKHAGQGATLSVRLAEDDGNLRFSVVDDGRGYDSTTTAPSGGLQNMADRIGALGGQLTIDSQPGSGTSVTGTIPLEAS